MHISREKTKSYSTSTDESILGVPCRDRRIVLRLIKSLSGQFDLKTEEVDSGLLIDSQSSNAVNDFTRRSADMYLTPFQRLDWRTSWQHKVGMIEGILPITVFLTFMDRTIAVLPLAVYRFRNLKVLAWHAFSLSDYCVPIVDRNYLNEFCEMDFENILKHVAFRIGAIDLVYLTKQPLSIQGRRNPLNLSTSFNYHVHSHAINFTAGETWEQFLTNKRTPSTLRQLRKKERLLKAFGEVEFRVAPTSEYARAIAEHCLSAKSRQLARLGHPDPFSSPAVREFLIDFFSDGIGHSTWATALTLNGEILATSIGMAGQNGWLLYQMAMEGDHVSHCSPGSQLFSGIMRHCLESGIAQLDLALGDEKYKLEWCDEHKALQTSVLPLTLKGKIIAPILRIRAGVMKFMAAKPKLYEHGKVLKQRMRSIGVPI